MSKKENVNENTLIDLDLGNVRGLTGPKGDAYTLTEQDRIDIAAKVGAESFVTLVTVNVDVYDASKSTPPTYAYIPATVTLKDNAGNVINSYPTNSKRLVMHLCQNTKYTLSFSATGYETIADRSITVTTTSQDVAVGASPGTTTMYEVRWVNPLTTPETILFSETVAPHASSTYTGADPTMENKIFYKWDKGTNGKLTDVVANTTVNTVFATPTEPASPAIGTHDYIWSEDPADDSAYTLNEMLGIVKLANDPSDYVAIGDKIKFTDQLNSSWFDEEITFTVCSFGHYKKTGSTEFAKISFMQDFLLKQGHRMNATNTNIGGYATSEMRTWLNGTFINILPKLIKGMCTDVDVISSIGDARHSWSTSENNKIYLASYTELGYGAISPYKEEIDDGANEKQFPIFTDNASRIRGRFNRPDTANYWWLRSPNSSSSTYFGFVSYYGTYGSNNANLALGVVVGFSC